MSEQFRGCRVLVTGHTGFKGAWLSLWLELLGAEVVGLSLEPDSGSLYSRANLAGRWSERLSDIREMGVVERAIAENEPALVFHLAAQPLVNVGYQDPLGTFKTNVLGTMHVMEAVRQSRSVAGCVVITTDKVYRPSPSAHRHTENDPLGADDPYSASKAAAEHVVTAWRGLIARESGIPIATARAGNVIGGGDNAVDRLLPDLVRAFSKGRICEIRHPGYTRPWQHVLDPLSGYLALGARVLNRQPIPEAINFGPAKEEAVSVIADLAVQCWGPGASWAATTEGGMPETTLLSLDSGLALKELGWQPMWETHESVRRTIHWWKQLSSGAHPIDLCFQDIHDYMSGESYL